MTRRTIDLETFYDTRQGYSLSKMRTFDYICDPRFQLISLSTKTAGGKCEFYFGEEAEAYLHESDFSKDTLVCHNGFFDFAVLKFRFKKTAAFYLDTLALSRALIRPHTGRCDLKTVVDYLGLPAKGGFIARMNGKRREDLSNDEILSLRAYNNLDIMGCEGIAEWALPQMPRDELLLQDAVIRMYLTPQLRINARVVEKFLNEHREEKKRLLAEAGITDKKLLMSNQKLALVLSLLLGGNDRVPTKVSPTTGKPTYAFSKKDKAFTDLLEDEDPRVQTVVAARLSEKNTILETRAEAFLEIANKWGLVAVPLNYAGAHTLRLSGADGLNMQNLVRGSALRKALEPFHKDYVVVVVDSSQVEARFLATWAGQDDVVEKFRLRQDVYAHFASSVYGFPVTKATHPGERFVGKVGVLSLGYQCGIATFFEMLRVAAIKEKFPAPTHQLAGMVHAGYQKANPYIVDLWQFADKKILRALAPNGHELETGPFVVRPGEVELPNGMKLAYPNLRTEWNDMWKRDERVYGPHDGKFRKTIYGGKMVENLTQACTRLIVTDVWLEMQRRGFPPALQVHDELVFVVHKRQAEEVLATALDLLRTPPCWMPDLPLDAEGSIAENYGAAK